MACVNDTASAIKKLEGLSNEQLQSLIMILQKLLEEREFNTFFENQMQEERGEIASTERGLQCERIKNKNEGIDITEEQITNKL